MKVIVTYFDEDALTKEEAVKLAKLKTGTNSNVEVTADSFAPHDLILFALQQMITAEQADLIFSGGLNYNSTIRVLRGETIAKLTEMLDTVIIENEARLGLK